MLDVLELDNVVGDGRHDDTAGLQAALESDAATAGRIRRASTERSSTRTTSAPCTRA